MKKTLFIVTSLLSLNLMAQNFLGKWSQVEGHFPLKHKETNCYGISADFQKNGDKLSLNLEASEKTGRVEIGDKALHCLTSGTLAGYMVFPFPSLEQSSFEVVNNFVWKNGEKLGVYTDDGAVLNKYYYVGKSKYPWESASEYQYVFFKFSVQDIKNDIMTLSFSYKIVYRGKESFYRYKGTFTK